MKKAFCAFLTGLSLLVLLAACGGGGSSPTPPPNGGTNGTVTLVGTSNQQ